jgi:transcriptional regulator with XRE-family HTH domain
MGAYLTRRMDTIRTKRHRKLIEVLAAQRKKRNVSQTELARKLQKSQTWVARIERHGRRVDVVEFLYLCEELGLNPVKLIRKIQDVAPD